MIRVYDEDSQRDRDARAQGRFQRVLNVFLFAGPASQFSSPERHLRQPHFSPTPLHENNFYVLDVYEVRLRKYKRGVDPISDKLPFV